MRISINCQTRLEITFASPATTFAPASQCASTAPRYPSVTELLSVWVCGGFVFSCLPADLARRSGVECFLRTRKGRIRSFALRLTVRGFCLVWCVEFCLLPPTDRHSFVLRLSFGFVSGICPVSSFYCVVGVFFLLSVSLSLCVGLQARLLFLFRSFFFYVSAE
ncbi:hypothetical protein VTO42DRAFT_2889 [Malbranchea cinnamomea]